MIKVNSVVQESVEEPAKDVLDGEKLMLAPGEEEEVDPDKDRLDAVETTDYWSDAVRAAFFILVVLLALILTGNWDSNLSALTISAV